MNKLLIIICCLVLPFQLFGDDEDDLVVHVATESNLIPLYFSEIQSSSSEFSNDYLNKLAKVLRFDLNYNGLTKVINQNEDKARYIVKVNVGENKMTATIFSTSQKSAKASPTLTLTGKLNEDRRRIHALADFIHKSISGKDGIATTSILYTLKVPNLDPTYKSDSIAEVWESDYDGANARQITHDNRLCVTPCYLPPKTGFAPGSFFYVCYQSGQPKIYVASLKDGKGYKFTTIRGNQLMPAVSKQRDNVAFVCDVGGNPDIFMQQFNPDAGACGKPRQLYATVHGTQGSPTFSPDGNKIAFVSNKDGSPRIYVMDIPPEGTLARDMKPKLISKQSKESTSPVWSPDGTKIAYSAMMLGARQIFVYDFETGQEEQITEGNGNKENPSWAPDSLHLVFNSDNSRGVCELYLVNLNQNEAVKVSQGSGEKRFPCWEPRS